MLRDIRDKIEWVPCQDSPYTATDLLARAVKQENLMLSLHIWEDIRVSFHV